MHLTLSTLPAEIKAKIAANLGQIDALSLLKTGKAMEEAALQRVYDKVVVDSCYTQFSKEYTPCYTYINSSYRLKRFFRAKRRRNVRGLYVLSLPDSTNVYDAETHDLMGDFFTDLHNLHELVWQAENFTLDQLMRLPNRLLLERLALNINFASQTTQTIDKVTRGSLVFVNLHTLSLRPFASSERLEGLLTALLGHNSTQNHTLLRTLALARFDNDSPALIPARELHLLGTVNPPTEESQRLSRDIDIDTLSVLLSPKFAHRIAQLSELCLSSVLVNEKEAVNLAKCVELSQLKTLVLKNVAEYGNGAENTYAVGFLGMVGTRLANLVHLHLDFRETDCDTIAGFLRGLPQLTSLDLVVRMNALKRRNVDEAQLYYEYGAAIAGQQKLNKLSMEVRQEHSFCEIVMSTPKAMLLGLETLHELTSLRLSCVQVSANEQLTKVLGKLDKLVFFDTFGVNTGGVPNLGLGMVHPNIYDEWFKVQHFAESFSKKQDKISYVRINECVFECAAGSVHPRDTIDRWFDGKVRV